MLKGTSMDDKQAGQACKFFRRKSSMLGEDSGFSDLITKWAI